MAHHHETSPAEKHERKLRKIERRLRERLQEAQDARERALERLQRTEMRLQKRTARVQRIATRLAIVRQQRTDLVAPSSSNSVTVTPVESNVEVEHEQDAKDASEHHNQRDQPDQTDQSVPPPLSVQEEALSTPVVSSTTDKAQSEIETAPSTITTAEVMQHAQQARAVAKETEQAARLAAQRAQQVEEHLDRLGSGRHLLQELAELQNEAEKASYIAQEAEDKAREAERLARETEHLSTGPLQQESSAEPVTPSDDAPEQDAREPEHTQDVASGHEENDDTHAQQNNQHSQVQDTVVEEPSIAQLLTNEPTNIAALDQEEETVAMIASMMIADVAAATAAKAEALAEASSVHTREMRRAAEEADTFLQQLQAAIASGVLTGGDAESALRYAEREATHAHAALADAEATEAQAVRAAMDAEAEAEVAEGMSFAVEQRGSYEEHVREAEHPATPQNGQAHTNSWDEDETLELPIVRPKESA